VANNPPPNVTKQIQKVGLPTAGAEPFIPKLVSNRKGEQIIKKDAIKTGPKQGRIGYVDSQDRIWIRDRAHAGLPDHWDVQESGGGYFRVDLSGNVI